MGGFDPPRTMLFFSGGLSPRMPGGGCGLSAVAFCSLSFLLFRASESRASEFPLLPLFRNSLFHSPPTHRLLSLSAGSTRSSRREPIQALHVRSRLVAVPSQKEPLAITP